MAKSNKGLPRLEVTVADNHIYAQYFKNRSSSPGNTWGVFEPSVEQDKIIRFCISQLEFMVNDGIFDTKALKGASGILTELVKLLGEYLYQVLFRAKPLEEGERTLEQLLIEALEDSPNLLRIELNFKGDSEKYAAWPWEYLYKPKDEKSISKKFLAKEVNLVLIRKYGGTPLTIKPSNKPKVLLIISNPDGLSVDCDFLISKLEDLENIDLTIKQKKAKWEGDKMVALPEACLDSLKKTLSETSFDIVHFVGHGQCTAYGAKIALVKTDDQPDWKSDQQFAELINCTQYKPKLVFLQACESALPDTYRGVSGVAREIANLHIPAIVAMQYKIQGTLADKFAISFYEAIVKEQSIEFAVKAGRLAMDDQEEGLQYHAFGLPVLYLQSYDSIFKRAASQQDRPYCPSCKKMVEEDSIFCKYCGASLKDKVTLGKNQEKSPLTQVPQLTADASLQPQLGVTKQVGINTGSDV